MGCRSILWVRRQQFSCRQYCLNPIQLGFGKVAILHDNTTYAKGLADETKALLEGNVEIVFYDALTPGERDYNAILTKMKAAGPEVVFFTGYYPEAGLLLRRKTLAHGR